VQATLAAIATARAAARERVWRVVGAPTQDGRVVIDLDATLVTAHSDKQDATRTWKKGFGFHPVRREALTIRAEVRDHRLRPVAAGR
jgi:hypothetical protein